MKSPRTSHHARPAALLLAASLALLPGCNTAPPTDPTADLDPNQQLVTGRYIASTQPQGQLPSPNTPQPAGSIPAAVALSPDRKYAVVTGQGYKPALTVINLATGQTASQTLIPRPRTDRTLGLYHGIAIAPDNTVFAAQGSHATIAAYQLSPEGALSPLATLKGRDGDMFAGLAYANSRLFATSNNPTSDLAPLNVPGAVVAFDVSTGKELGRLEFPSPLGTTNFPLAIAATADANTLYVASQRDNLIYIIDASNPAAMKIQSTIPTGSNPVALLLDEPNHTLFVANADSDTVSLINTSSAKVTDTIVVRPAAAADLPSASPTGLALSPDGADLYVSLGELNAVAVIDLAENELEGYIPAGFYPTAVATDGSHLLTVNAKGTTLRHPKKPGQNVSPLNLIEGDTITRNIPTKSELKKLTEETLTLARVTKSDFRLGNPIEHVGVQHVIYIIKENRTYDQVLGDLPQGNGHPDYVMFGRDVTPNLHALAERFVLLDNFFDCGDVSGEGWVWSTQAFANEYVTRNVPYSYSSRGREYDYEGMNNGYPTAGFPAKGPDGKPLSTYPAFANGAPAVRDVAYSPAGSLWDLCKNHGRSYRNYGFFLSEAGTIRSAEGGTKRTLTIFPDNYPTSPNLQPAGRNLQGISNIDYRKFDLTYADSDGPENYFKSTNDPRFLRPTRTYGSHNAPSRFSEWKNEFDQLLAKDPTGKSYPNMTFLRLGNDHTSGMAAGKHTPRSMIADNDYAIGQVVEAVSHSPIWSSTAIFILEDDAQNGPDHIDAHRSICFVISPWVKKSSIDHSFHNTVSCIRTMELLLALPPMNANDAAARPMTFFDTAPTNNETFKAILPNPNYLLETNPQRSTAGLDPQIQNYIAQSDTFDFNTADKAPADLLNQILWASVKGPKSPLPETPTGPINHPTNTKDADDE